VKRLVGEYAGIDDQLLREAVMKIETRLGKPKAKGALISISEKDYPAVANQVLSYYDETYSYSIHRRENQKRYRFPVEQFNASEIAAGLAEFAYKTLINGSDLPGL
jgi:hypothetical protein